MLRMLTIVSAVALASAPVRISGFQIMQRNATAGATLKAETLMPGKMRTFTAGTEYRVCNEGTVPVRMFAANSMTGVSTESLLEPGRCVQCMGTMMSFKNESQEPVMLYAYGGMGGRPGRGSGAH